MQVYFRLPWFGPNKWMYAKGLREVPDEFRDALPLKDCQIIEDVKDIPVEAPVEQITSLREMDGDRAAVEQMDKLVDRANETAAIIEEVKASKREIFLKRMADARAKKAEGK